MNSSTATLRWRTTPWRSGSGEGRRAQGDAGKPDDDRRRRPTERGAGRAAARGPSRSERPRRAGPSGRAGCSAPTRWRGTTRRPPAFTVAPAAASPGPPRPAPTPVASKRPTADEPIPRGPSVAIFSRPHDRSDESPDSGRYRHPGACSRPSPLGAVLQGAGYVLRSMSSRARRAAPEDRWRGPRSHRLRPHDGTWSPRGDLQVRWAASPLAALCGSGSERHSHARHACRRWRRTVPAPRPEYRPAPPPRSGVVRDRTMARVSPRPPGRRAGRPPPPPERPSANADHCQLSNCDAEASRTVSATGRVRDRGDDQYAWRHAWPPRPSGSLAVPRRQEPPLHLRAVS